MHLPSPSAPLPFKPLGPIETRGGPYQARNKAPLLTPLPLQANWNEELKDFYQAYNKPVAVRDWLEKHPAAPEKWVLLLDADMLLRHPFRSTDFNVSRGWAVAGHYDYMKVWGGGGGLQARREGSGRDASRARRQEPPRRAPASAP